MSNIEYFRTESVQPVRYGKKTFALSTVQKLDPCLHFIFCIPKTQFSILHKATVYAKNYAGIAEAEKKGILRPLPLDLSPSTLQNEPQQYFDYM
jgi:hypothetical protein